MDKLEVLEQYFGYQAFRPGQTELIDSILAGRDVFGIMPTGGGKSLCYQVPAMILRGTTLVISPLISLMRDQVLALKAAGIPAAYINSTLTWPQLQAVCRNMLAGQYKIVYVAPERLDSEWFASAAARMQIPFIAVDEAHCISQWGQDFRPSYLRIVDFVESLPYRPVLGAFTATATQQVREDVERILKLREPTRTVTGFDRPNLFFDVQRPASKDAELLKLLDQRRGKSGIVYCATRKKVESVCQLLQDKGYGATRYHAGLEEEERAKNQEDFLYDRKTIMVATNAFGMGIDKSNVNFVIHYNMPKSLEAYYQEAGRAGRDGTEADCILLFHRSDVETARFLINNASDNEEMTPEQREAVRNQDLARLAAMERYCKTGTCLRGEILEYFGQKHPEICGNCGVCRGQFETVDITREAQMILSCIRRISDKLGYCVGADVVGRVLRGSRDKRILELGLDSLSTYGLLKNRTRSDIRAMMDHLEVEGYLMTEQEHRTLHLTGTSGQILFHRKIVTMRVPKQEETKPEQKTGKLSTEQTELFEALKELRFRLAQKAGVPAFTIFSNATLIDMANKRPRNLTEFRKINGVGEIKCAWYGKDFLRVIRETVGSEE